MSLSLRRLLPNVELAALLVAATANPLLPVVLHAQAAQRTSDVSSFDDSRLSGMRYRMIGPERGGRVTAVTGVLQRAEHLLHGFHRRRRLEDHRRRPHLGEHLRRLLRVRLHGRHRSRRLRPEHRLRRHRAPTIRSNVSIGRGIYKSTDAGKTWTFVGLPRRRPDRRHRRPSHQSRHRLRGGARQSVRAEQPTRGVYRTKDGGKTWKQVLFLSDSTGAADLELQPGNPNVVFASMWHGQRKPWTIISGAREGGIYKSTDGGDTWQQARRRPAHRRLRQERPRHLGGRRRIASTR